MIVRIIGDVHGKQERYVEIAQDAPEGRSVCLGDVGFNYDYLDKRLDPEMHRIVAGNHDNYEQLTPHFLGDYGEIFNCYYVRGAWSIDQKYRTPGLNWFAEEQISMMQSLNALSYLQHHKPKIMLSHDCPDTIKRAILPANVEIVRTQTCDLLETISKVESIRQWYFGHNHTDWEMYQNNCLFRCVDELSYVDIIT